MFVAVFLSGHLYSGNPLSLRIDLIKGVWMNEEIKVTDQAFDAAMPAVITDYGSSEAPISMMGFVLSDVLTDVAKGKTTSKMMVRVDKASLSARNDGSFVDYTHDNIRLTVDQKIFSGSKEILTRTVTTTGALRITAGGLFTEPNGNLHFALPAGAGRTAISYDVALGGQFVPFSLPL